MSIDADKDLVDANTDLGDADKNVADADTSWSYTQVSAKREEKTGDLRKLHNKTFVVFHEDEIGGACCVNKGDQKCIDA